MLGQLTEDVEQNSKTILELTAKIALIEQALAG